jgi:hypothetical protein
MKLNPEKLKKANKKLDVEKAVAAIHSNGENGTEATSRYTMNLDIALNNDIKRHLLDSRMSMKEYIIGLIKKDLYGK